MMGKIASLLLAAGAIGGCAGQAHMQDRIFTASSGLTGEYHVHVASMLARKFGTVIRQQYDFSCGSAALATVLHYHYGLPRGETDVFAGMWQDGDQANIRKVGFSLLDMK